MTAPLSIGVVCFGGLGGSSVVASEIAFGLACRGHRVHLMASTRPSRPLPECDQLRVHVIEVPQYPLFEHAPYAIAVASKIVDVTLEHGLDLVQAHYALPHAASAQLAKQVLGASAPAIVASLHGTDVTLTGSAPAYRPVIAHAVAEADGITVPSDSLRRAAHETLGVPRSREIEVVPNFVDTDHFTPPASRQRSRFAGLFDSTEEGPVLIHVSNFRAVKRVGDLLEALARVRRSVPARLLLVGDGPERARAEDRAAALGLSRHACFLGRRLDFAEYLRHADAFLLASESESFGVAALEALSAGVPVVAYRVGGLPELVTPDVGRLVEPFDVDALARAIVEVVVDEAGRETLGRAARKRAIEGFRSEPALDGIESYFHRVLAERRERTERR